MRFLIIQTLPDIRSRQECPLRENPHITDVEISANDAENSILELLCIIDGLVHNALLDDSIHAVQHTLRQSPSCRRETRQI